MRRCKECNGEILCMTCKNQLHKNKDFQANLNLLNRQARNQFDHKLPYFNE